MTLTHGLVVVHVVNAVAKRISGGHPGASELLFVGDIKES